MNTFFTQGGSIMYLLLILATIIVIWTLKTAIELFGRGRAGSRVEIGLNSILFWGGISAGLGIFGHFSGIYFAMQQILNATDTSPAIVADGYFMAFTDIIFGLLIFLLATAFWSLLRWKYKKLLLK
jgi:biopolymer transport protein ExbB/TolQ